MATLRPINFCIPDAQRLADLSGVLIDLRDACEYCDLSVAIDFLDPKLSKTRAGLCAAALIAYGRTMSTGVRQGVTAEQIERLSELMRARHDYFKDLRDKWIAHSVNGFEENEVSAYVRERDDGAVEYMSISTMNGRVLLLQNETMLHLKELAQHLETIVRADVEIETQKVDAIAKAMPISEILARDRGAQIMSTSAKSAAKSRSKFKG